MTANTDDAILEVRGAARAFGSLRAVNDVSFTVPRGSITALIGPNGAGKTTLFNLIGGYQPLNAGTVRFLGQPIEPLLPDEIARRGVGRTFQNLQLFDNMTVLENVMCGRHRLMAAGLPQISARLPAVPREERAAGAARACGSGIRWTATAPRICGRTCCRSDISDWWKSPARSRSSRRSC